MNVILHAEIASKPSKKNVMTETETTMMDVLIPAKFKNTTAVALYSWKNQYAYSMPYLKSTSNKLSKKPMRTEST